MKEGMSFSSSSLQRIALKEKEQARFCRSGAVSSGCYPRWIWFAIILCSCISSSLCDVTTSNSAGTTSAPAMTTPITTTPMTSTSTSLPTPQRFNIADCVTSFDSSDQRRYICLNHKELFPLLKFAEQVGKSTCEEDFEHEHWNCSSFSLLKQPSITKGDYIYKESAYVYSLSMAVIAHTVAMGCVEEIFNCSCPEKEGGCPDPVTYGLHIAATFLNMRYTSSGGGLKQELVIRNFRATEIIIQSVMSSTFKKCSCHGISGSCTFSVCHSELPPFSTLAKRVKQAYNDSCLVLPNGHSRNDWVAQCDHPITDSDLLFTKSNTWCKYDPEIGSAGVVGRECDPHPEAPNSCNKLCGGCKRPSIQQTVEEVVQCDCQFLFCCEIKCEICTERRTYFSCS